MAAAAGTEGRGARMKHVEAVAAREYTYLILVVMQRRAKRNERNRVRKKNSRPPLSTTPYLGTVCIGTFITYCT